LTPLPLRRTLGASNDMHPLETYLEELRAIRSSGAVVKETSGYGALANLLNTIGHTLKPKVRCFIHVKNSGSGLPDGGLFTPDQLKNTDEEAPLLGIPLPARGVIEVKATSAEVDAVAATLQVREYVRHYGAVLVTNYRSFLLLKRGDNGKPVRLESFQLAPDEKSFWVVAGQPRKAANELGERFAEYLKRVLLHAAPLNNPKDVAFFLASYARDARVRVEGAKDLPALAAVRAALEEALGMKFEAEKGEHFFRSTLVQTLFYGVFSAWVLWHKTVGQASRLSPSKSGKLETGATPVLQFDWRSAAWTLHVPMIKALFEQVATPTKLGPLGLVEVLDWTAAALNRVDRNEFFKQFAETHAVQYFYEPFLEAFDPELRKQLGVWYTPPEIVQYQVARVDAALREELDIPDGLADPRVFVLDLSCGTGAYVIEVLRVIAQTLKDEKGEGDALNAEVVKEAAQKRVFGFEIMPAPFVVAHLQMGLLLQNLGVPLDDVKGERAGIFLTNSLTGWDFAGENPKLANWPELEAERAGAGKVKQEKPILVIIGNPPYNAFAGISPEEEQGLVDSYKAGLVKEWGIKKFNLDDLYVRFFRLAERRIAEKTGLGIVSFISNFSYLGDPSFVVMRQRFLREFDSLWFDCLNGDSRETGKLTPEGKPDPSVFSTEYNREGIRVGTAIGTLIRSSRREPAHSSPKAGKSQSRLTSAATGKVFFRQFWGVDKRAELLESLNAKKFAKQYEKADPKESNRFSFRISDVGADYLGWPALLDLCAQSPISGLQEMRKGTMMSVEKADLEKRMRQYFDENLDWDEIVRRKTGPTEDGGRFNAKETRAKVLAAEKFNLDRIIRYALYPFDLRWAYQSPTRPLWNEPRPALAAQCWKGNQFLVTRMMAERPNENFCVFATKALPDYHLLRPNAVAIPFRLRSVPKDQPKKKDDGNGEFGNILHEAAPAYNAGKITANLSPAVRAYLTKLGIKNPDDDAATAALIWMHALAIGYSPTYLTENADGVRQDWPRIPLPDSKATLLASAELGKQVAALLDTEIPVQNVTAGKVRPELVRIAVVTRLNEKLNLSLTAGWGHAGQNGVTMPGKGKLETRGYMAEETAAFDGRAGSPLPAADCNEIVRAGEGRRARSDAPYLGHATHDIFLNESACWSNVPEKVWDYTIGGYQVIKKWLSYREFELLGRPLTPDEAREVTHTARRIAALILLQPELDKNYQAVKAAAFDWKP
jgi:hypothetical protein